MFTKDFRKEKIRCIKKGFALFDANPFFYFLEQL